MTIGESVVVPTEKEKPRPSTANMWFSKDGVVPDDFSNARIDTDVTVVIKGRIRSISGPSDYDESRSMDMKISSISISGPPDEKTSMDAALKQTQKTI